MIEMILKRLNGFPYDKALHSFYGSLLFIGSLFAALVLGLSWVVALYVVVITAIGKEVYDAFNRKIHTPDLFDIVATIAVPVLFALYLYIRG